MMEARRRRVRRALDRARRGRARDRPLGLVRGLRRQARAGARLVEPGRGAVLQLHACPSRPASSAIVAPDEPPLLGLVSRLAPALVGGNAVVAVASETSPLAAIELAEVLATSDLPGGVVNLLTGYRAELAPWLASHMDVNAIDLTGADGALSADLERAAAENVKRVDPRRAGLAEPVRDLGVPRAEDRLAPDRRLRGRDPRLRRGRHDPAARLSVPRLRRGPREGRAVRAHRAERLRPRARRPDRHARGVEAAAQPLAGDARSPPGSTRTGTRTTPPAAASGSRATSSSARGRAATRRRRSTSRSASGPTSRRTTASPTSSASWSGRARCEVRADRRERAVRARRRTRSRRSRSTPRTRTRSCSRATGKRVLIAMDETHGWTPPDLGPLDLAVLPVGVFEHHPYTGERMIPEEFCKPPVQKTRYPQALEMARALGAAAHGPLARRGDGPRSRTTSWCGSAPPTAGSPRTTA